MSNNTSVGIYLSDFESLALEERVVGLSPSVLVNISSSIPGGLSPGVFTEVKSVPLDTLSPLISGIVLYIPPNIISPVINSVQTNLIERTEASEIRTNTLSWDIEQVVGVAAAGYKMQGASSKLYSAGAHYELNESESGGTFITTSGIFVLPQNSSSGVNFKFFRGPSAENLCHVYATGTDVFWDNLLAMPLVTGVLNYLDLAEENFSHIICNGNGTWYEIIGNNTVSVGESTPLTIFGDKLAAWYRPDSGHVSIDGSGFVTQLDDRSGSGHHMTLICGTPELITASGIPFIDFEITGVADGIGIATPIVEDEPMAFWVVARSESAQNPPGTMVSIGRISGPQVIRLQSNNSRVALMDTFPGGTATHGTALTLGSIHAFFGETSASNARRVNVDGGVEVINTSTSSLGAQTHTVIGGRINNTAPFAIADGFDGQIYEVVILNAVPSNNEQIAYLAYSRARFLTP